MSIRHLDQLLSPASIAVIGATERERAAGRAVLEELIAGGFEGPIWPVNPKHERVCDLPCVPRVAALPGVPDLGIVTVPAPKVAGVIEDLGRAGCRAALVMTPGIARHGLVASEMLQAARTHGLRLLGPGSAGILRPSRHLNASLAPRRALPGEASGPGHGAHSGRLALISQSGSLIGGVVDWAAARGIGFSHVVALGDEADVSMADLLDYLAQDAESRAILLYLERIEDARAFMPAARAAARVKPVIALKGGAATEGARAAASHTGAMAGTDALFDAALARAGILRIRSLEALFDAAEALDHVRARTGEPAGDRFTIITNGGGAGVLAADALDALGARLAPLSGETMTAIEALLPEHGSAANPVDLDGGAEGEHYGAALEAVLTDPSVDAALVLHSPGALADPVGAAEAVAGAAKRAKRRSARRRPVFACWLGARPGDAAAQILENADIPCFETPDDAVSGAGYLVRRTRLLEELTAVPPSLPDGPAPDWEAARAIIARAAARGARRLNEAEGKAVLTAAGIPTVRTEACAPDPEIAEATARRLGEEGVRRFALKVLSDDLQHKSDAGGVVLDLASPGAVGRAASRLLAEVARRAPGATVTGLSVQEMLRRPAAHELIAGLSDDPVFGPAILFGSGGLAVEAVGDKALALPPLDAGLAAGLIGRTRIARLLAGYRTRPPADLEAIAAILVRLGELARALPMVCELDINPLLADDAGAVALDARVVIARGRMNDPVPNPRLAIRPYPVELEGMLPAKGGEVFVRPVKPEDAPRFAAFFAAASPEDLRLRFFGAMRTVPDSLIARLTQIDYARAIAFVAFETRDSDDILGVGRLASDADGERAEFSVMVRSDLKGRGLGRALMERLLAHGRAEGMRAIWGEILPENTGMLTLAKHLGFERHSLREEGVEHVEITLD
ncbi:MAG: bifunctional acetate--CoA ligase family protein/GNAT family N-acetyltransferase [Pseudomonadota bacterium]